MTPDTSDLIIIGDGAALNLRRIVHSEWYQPQARRGQPAPARQLLITTDVIATDQNGNRQPYLVFLEGEQADRAWELIQAHARPAPLIHLARLVDAYVRHEQPREFATAAD